jgi:hypothetical protein
MPKYMLLLHQTPGSYEGKSPEEIREIVEKYQAWLERIRASGRYVVSDKLREEGGRIVQRQEGRISVIDGPYSESKEIIGGYFTIRASSYEDAVEVVRECPFLETGSVAIRETDPRGCGDE